MELGTNSRIVEDCKGSNGRIGMSFNISHSMMTEMIAWVSIRRYGIYIID